MRRTALAACALAAGCAPPGEVVFGVDGFADVAVPQRGSVIALWEVKSPAPAYFYKYGDGIRVGSQLAPCTAVIIEGPASPRCAW